MPALPLVDLLAFIAFVASWAVMAEHRTLLGKPLSAVMTRHRFTGMRAVGERANRVADTAEVVLLASVFVYTFFQITCFHTLWEAA